MMERTPLKSFLQFNLQQPLTQSGKNLRTQKDSSLLPCSPAPYTHRVMFQGNAISPDQPLFDAGFDSMTAEEFVGRLQEKLVRGGWVRAAAGGGEEAAAAAAVNSTTVFDCPTARHMAEHMESVLVGAAGSAAGDTSGLG